MDATPTTEKTNEERNLENWLPITASRKAKWWYSAFHNVTAMVGAGVLGLPFAMSQLGWSGGVLSLCISWIVTFYSLWQLVAMHELVPGKRFDRYHELGQHVFGPKRGLWLVGSQQLAVQVSTDIVYMVTGGKSLKKAMDLTLPFLGSLRKTWFIVIFACLQLALSQIRNFNALRGLSLFATVMSISYSMIAFVASLIRGKHEGISYGTRSSTTVGMVLDAFNALGTIGFAFAGHSVVLEIQATIPSTPEKPSKRPMWRGAVVAYIIVAICYFPCALAGYYAFGNIVEDDILISLERPRWLIAVANMMVFFHVLGSYQIFAMPVFDMIESVLVKEYKFSPRLLLRLISRSSYVVITALIGISIPFFGGLLGSIGGLVFAPTSYFIPCIMWLMVKKPKPYSFHWMASWISIIFGTMLMVLAPIGGIRQIVLEAKSYKFFS